MTLRRGLDGRPLDRGAMRGHDRGMAPRSLFTLWPGPLLRSAALLVLLVAAGSAALAQSPGPAIAQAGRGASGPPAQGSAPPYDDELLKLSEILGALHYLRPLCGAAAEAQTWRVQMQALLEAEAPSDARRGALVASFNRGYSSYAQVYRTCTPSADLAVQRQLTESARLAHDIVVRFGAN